MKIQTSFFKLQNRLKLKAVGTRKISIQTFRSNCSENILEKVNLHIFALDGSEICVTCFVKVIFALLNNQAFSKRKKKRKTKSKENFLILEILFFIGADNYSAIITNQVIKTKEGTIALDMKVGWILSGPVNNLSASVNNFVLFLHAMEVQLEFMDINNILKQDLKRCGLIRKK